MKAVPGIVNQEEYADLLTTTLPQVIHTEAENEYYVDVLTKILRKNARTVEDNRVAELLTLLIEDFEDKNYSLPPASPSEVIRHLMDVNGLRQIDMVDVFGTASIVSEVLSGKRSLAKSHIEKLSARFHISPEVFFVNALTATS